MAIRIRYFFILLLFIAIGCKHSATQERHEAETQFLNKDFPRAKSIAFQKLSADSTAVKDMLVLAKIYARTFQRDSSRLWLEKAKKIIDHNNSKIDLFQYFLWMGYNLEVNKNYDKALQYYLQAMSLLSLVEEPFYHELLYQRILLINSENIKKNEPEKWVLAYTRLKDSLNDPFYANSYFNTLGKHYLYNKEPLKAKHFFDKSIALSIELQDTSLLNNSYLHKAIFYSEHTSRRDSARYYYDLAKRLCDCDGNLLFQATHNSNTAMTYFYEKNDTRASDFFHKVLSRMPSARNNHIYSNVYRRLYQINKRQHRRDSSLYYLELHLDYKDRLATYERDRAVNEIQTIYNVNEKEKKILAEQQRATRNRNWLIAATLALILGTGIAVLLQKNTTKKRQLAEQETLLKQQRVDNLLKEQELLSIDAMIAGQEKERKKVAGELHDDLGSLMATIKLHFDNVGASKQDPALQHAKKLLEEAYQKVRGMAHHKNSGVMSDQGLLPAIKKMASTISNTGSLEVIVEDFGLGERMENSLELSIFRMVQELVANAIKHAEASQITIQLTQHEDNLNIIVEDNGQGFDRSVLDTKQSGMGLTTIEKRIEHLEGNFTIDSVIGKGTSILIDIPV